MDPVYDASLFAVHVYSPEDFEWNARHADVMSRDERNRPFVNFTNFNAATDLAPVLHAPMENTAMPAPGQANDKRIQHLCGKCEFGLSTGSLRFEAKYACDL